MTDTIDAQISAFIDDELITEESELLVRRLCNDEQMRQTAARYTLIGDALRGSLTDIQTDLNGSIMSAIRSEPPQAAAPVVPETASRGGFGRLIGGGAIAAAVAVSAIFLLQSGTPTGAPANLNAGSLSLPTPGAEVVPSNDGQPGDVLNQVPLVRGASTAASYTNYYQRHNQYAQRTIYPRIVVRPVRVVPTEAERAEQPADRATGRAPE